MKALILDGYGTLFFTGTGSVDAAGKVLAKRGRFDLDAKEFYARWKQIHRQHLEAPGTFLTEEVLYHRDLRELYAEYAIEGDPDEDVQIMLDILGNRTAYPEVKGGLGKALTSDDALHRLYIGHGSSAAGSGEAGCLSAGCLLQKDFGSINPIAVFTGVS